MSGPLFSLFIVHGYREAYYQLSEAERAQFWGRIGTASQAVGSKNLLTCNSVWCNEAAFAWGLEEFPDLNSVQELARLHLENQHLRYLETESFLGVKQGDGAIPVVGFPDPIYQLWMVKNDSSESMDSLPDALRATLWSQVGESIERNGGVGLILCDITWSNEEYRYFGITAWPSLEAEQAHFKDLEKIGWSRYLRSRTILGTALA